MTSYIGYEFGWETAGDREVAQSIHGVAKVFNVLERDALRAGIALESLGPSTERSARLGRDATEQLHKKILGLERQTAFKTLASQSKAYIEAQRRAKESTQELKQSIHGVESEAERLDRTIGRMESQTALKMQKAHSVEYRAAVRRARTATLALDDAIDKVGETGSIATGGLKAGMGGVVTAWNQGLELAGKVVDVLKQINELAQEGAALAGIEQNFAALGGTAEDLEKLKVATAGVFDNATLQKASTLSHELGVTDEALAAFGARAAITADEMGTLAEVDELLLEVIGSFGEESDEAAEALGKIGLAATEVMTEAERAAFAMGVSFKDLTERQKAQLISQAAVNIAMEKGVEVSDSLAVRFAASATSVEDLEQTFLKFFAETLADSGALDLVAGALENVSTLFEENRGTIEKLVDGALKSMSHSLPLLFEQLDVILPVVDALSPAIELIGLTMSATHIPMRATVDLLQLIGGVIVGGLAKGISWLIEAGAELADVFGQDELAASLNEASAALDSIAGDSMEFAFDQASQLGDEIEKGVGIATRYGEVILETGDKIGDMGREAEKAGHAMEDLHRFLDKVNGVANPEDIEAFGAAFEHLGTLGQIEDIDTLTAVIVGGAQNRQEALVELGRVEGEMVVLLDEYDRLVDSAQDTRFGKGATKDGVFIPLSQLEAEREGILSFGADIDVVAEQIDLMSFKTEAAAKGGGSKKKKAGFVEAFIGGARDDVVKEIREIKGLTNAEIAQWHRERRATRNDLLDFIGITVGAASRTNAAEALFELGEDLAGVLTRGMESGLDASNLMSSFSLMGQIRGAVDDVIGDGKLSAAEQEAFVHEQRMDYLDEMQARILEVKADANDAMGIFGSDIDPIAERWFAVSEVIADVSTGFIADLERVTQAENDLGATLTAGSSLVLNAAQSITQGFIKDKKTQAITEAAFAGAKGLFALGEGFLGNPAAFIAAGQYFASAAAYGIMAGTSTSKPSASKKSGAGRASTPSRSGGSARVSSRRSRRQEKAREVNQISIRALFSAKQGLGAFNDHGQRNTGVKLNSSVVSAEPLMTVL